MSKYIFLAKGRAFCEVDDDDYDRLSKHKWHVFYIFSHRYACGKSFYATATIAKKSILMHRAIIDCPAGMVIDHINGNGLDNRKSNLRVCTQKENVRNRRDRLGNIRLTHKQIKAMRRG